MKSLALLFAAWMTVISTSWSATPPPYPKSERITGITFHQETLERQAPGSDIWSSTWASDDQIYATYGDGGGFGGSDSKGRVSIGVAKIEGQPPAWKGVNLWGGFEPLSAQPATTGKGTILSVSNVLYLFVSEQAKWNRCRLWRSDDLGKSWNDRGWIFPETHKTFAFPGLIEFGRAQALNRDGYIYGLSDGSPYRTNDRRLYLFRVKMDQVEKTAAYEYFSGTAEKLKWSPEINDRQPIFENPAGISWGTTCVFHPATKRFLLTVNVDEKTGEWGVFESEHPWGPWRTIAHGAELPEWTSSPAEKNRPAYLHTFPGKWMSADGKTIWCIFDRGDHFNLMRCSLDFRP